MGCRLEESNANLSSNSIPASPGNQVSVSSSPTGSHDAPNKDGGWHKESFGVCPQVVAVLGC